MEDINKIIGKNLLQLRKNAKLTQMELADIFNYSDKSISKWETGESLPSIETLYDICVFYGVTLDALTKEETPTPVEQQPRKRNLLPVHLIITLLAVSAVWLLATILFVSFKISLGKNIVMFYLWAVPISCIVLLVFNCIWGRKYLFFGILTALIWSTLACIHIQLLKYNLWMVYLLGIPLQVGAILWAALLKKPRKPKQNQTPLAAKTAKPQRQRKGKAVAQPALQPEQPTQPEQTAQHAQQTHEEQSTQTQQTLPEQPIQDDAPKTKTTPAKKGTKKPKSQPDDDDFGFDFIQSKK